MPNRKQFLVVCLLSGFSFLTACTTVSPSSTAPINQSISWNQRKDQLNKVNHWKIQGAIAIHTTQQAVSASLNWKQQNRDYLINLFGPLGLGAVVISGNAHAIRLKTANGKIMTAKTPEQLIQKELGWQLPISNLYYWTRGLPIPNQKSLKHFDRYHHLTSMTQDGWQIHYLQYTGINSIDLPSKIDLSYPALKIRIVISHWTLF